jgi:hypothetical protein
MSLHPQPSPAQLAALKTIAAINGRNWKSRLRYAWETGRYAEIGGADIAGWLQTVRNEFGPSWLVRFRLPKEVR